jgi:hypothetical protein
MDCTPNALMAAATCYRGVAPGRQLEVQIYLLCQIANSEGFIAQDAEPDGDSDGGDRASQQAAPTDKTHAEE